MPTFNTHSGKNTRNAYILGIFIFLFSLFFQASSVNLFGSSFFDFNIFGVSAAKAACVPETPIQPPVEGLVPCGRIIDNQDTKFINENAPCDICAMFYMLKNILNEAVKISSALAILAIVISGLLYAFSAGDTQKIGRAKNAVYYTLIGLAIMFTAWLVIAVILKGMGYGDISNWNQVNCNLAPGGPPTVLPFCGDGIVNNGEMCDWAAVPNIRPCQAIVSNGLPSYCAGILSDGTQDCNCTCDGWNACVATHTPDLTEDKYGYGLCTNSSVFLTDYACCELYACNNDGPMCCNGANAFGATVASGYTQVGSTVACTDCSNPAGNCKIGRLGNNWAVAVNHSTASFRCWR